VIIGAAFDSRVEVTVAVKYEAAFCEPSLELEFDELACFSLSHLFSSMSAT
jgi:hypothetical protein